MDVIDSMNLPWFQLIRIRSEKFPGMGSENHIYLGRYLKVIAQYLKRVGKEKQLELPPYHLKKNEIRNPTYIGLNCVVYLRMEII